MNQEKYEQYEIKRKTLHKRFVSAKRRIRLIALAVMILLSVGAYFAFVLTGLMSMHVALYVAIEFVVIVGSLICMYQREKMYTHMERQQLHLLEQDEPFSRFSI